LNRNSNKESQSKPSIETDKIKEQPKNVQQIQTPEIETLIQKTSPQNTSNNISSSQPPINESLQKRDNDIKDNNISRTSSRDFSIQSESDNDSDTNTDTDIDRNRNGLSPSSEFSLDSRPTSVATTEPMTEASNHESGPFEYRSYSDIDSDNDSDFDAQQQDIDQEDTNSLETNICYYVSKISIDNDHLAIEWTKRIDDIHTFIDPFKNKERYEYEKEDKYCYLIEAFKNGKHITDISPELVNYVNRLIFYTDNTDKES